MIASVVFLWFNSDHMAEQVADWSGINYTRIINRTYFLSSIKEKAKVAKKKAETKKNMGNEIEK